MPPKPKSEKNAKIKNPQQSFVVFLNRQETFRHLRALCQNDELFSISDYRNKWQEEDYERIVISSTKKIDENKGEVRGAVIGSIRLLPSGDNTVIMFVHKDAFWNEKLSNSDKILFQKFIERARKHFLELNILQKDERKNFWRVITGPQAQIIAAIIAFVGIMIVTLINNTPETVSLLMIATQNANQATQTAEASAQFVRKTETHASLSTNTATVNPTQTQKSPLVVVDTGTVTPDQTPTAINTRTISSIIQENCFAKTNWSPYEKDGLITSTDGCWNLSKWGLYAIDNGVEIIPSYPYSAAQFHGIYTPISNKIEIRFKIRVEKISIDIEDRSANLGIGIINMEPLGPATAKIIYYHFIPADSRNIISLKLGQGGNYETALPFTLKIGSEQIVIMTIDGPLMNLNIDGKAYEEIINIGFDKRAFWISYSAPQGTKMIAYIYDIEIK